MRSGDSHVHHHGLLAGVGAGTAAVLLGGLFVAGVWHRVSGTVAQAVTVLVWALVAAVLAASAFVIAFLWLRLRHHARNPETLTRYPVRAEVIKARALPAQDAPSVPAPAPAAMLPPPVTHNWNLPQDPAAAAAVIRAIAEGEGRNIDG